MFFYFPQVCKKLIFTKNFSVVLWRHLNTNGGEIVEKHEQRLGRGNIEFAVISTKLNIIMAILAAVGVAVCGAVISIIL